MSERSGGRWVGSWGVVLVLAATACSSAPTAKTGTAGVGGTAGTSGGAGSSGGTTGTAGSQTIGTQGGTVVQNGVTLTILSDALAAGTPISVGTTTAPAGYDVASAAYQFGPAGTTFAHPVSVTIPLTSSDPNVHLFWSNASGGFDDLGGTVTGMTLTGQVMHFSIGFCARPRADAGTSDAVTDAPTTTDGGDAAAGAHNDGGGGGGPGGSTAAAGSGGTDAGAAGGSAGSTGSDASAGATGADAGGGTDAGMGVDAGALCKAPPLNLPFAAVTSTDAGVPPDGTAYGGGTPASGKYYLTGITHYGATAYAGSRQALYTIDAAAKTLQIATFQGIIGVTYANSDAHTLLGTVVCDTEPDGGATTAISWYYTVTGGTITLYQIGASDVLTIGLTGG